MAQFKVGTFCWADPGLDFSNMSVRRSLAQTLRSHFTNARSAFSSSALQRDKDNTSRKNSYQPGGTFMTTTGPWTTRCTGEPREDPSGLGRWSGLTFLGKKNKRLTVVTAYRSPRQQPTAGFGFYDQQYSLLLSQGVKKPNVRKQFITDLTAYLNALQSDGHEIILTLDANETLGQDTSHGIRHLMEECTLTDLHCLGPDEPPATYKYGTNRKIDYILGSPSVAQCIRRAGFLAYDNGIFSKHRGMFIDLDFQLLLGQVDNITPAPARGLNSENQVLVDKYLEALKKYLVDHHVERRIQEFTTVARYLTVSQCKEGYDAIDRDITRGMLHAEKVAKRPSGKYAWSPKLREAGLVARYWHLRLKAIEQNDYPPSIRGITRLSQRLRSLNITITDDLGNDPTPVKQRWKESLVTLKLIRNSAFDYRAVHLQSTLAMYEEIEPQGRENIADHKAKLARIRQLLSTEQMRKPFRTIHASTSDSRPTGLSKLFVPISSKKPHVAAKFCQPDGSLTKENLIAMAQSDKHSVKYATLVDCEEIETELLTYNRNWFRQAHTTPFGHGELYNLVGYDGLTEEADNLISGCCVDHMGMPMSRELQVFLEECKRPAKVLDIRTDITLDEFKRNVKKWKETTSTSPSGRHLGHYRTAILDDHVASLHTEMINLPIKYGFAPTRWTHSVTLLIEKDDGKPYLTRLRVIHLFEADYNLFLKILFGKRLIRNGERSNALNDQQHGSRPRRMTTDALFLSRLEKDLIRQTKANSAHMDNDATGCYDRIITSLGMMACRRLGMPSNAIRCQAETLLQMKYAVKHVYGVSSAKYTSSSEEPLFGTGQGSGASPAIWLSLVVILLNSLDRMSKEDNIPGLHFSDPWKDLKAEWRVGAFVDDTNQGVVDSTGRLSPDALVEQLRQAGQMWERLLHISGGSLNLSKCSWTLQYWQWINGRPRLAPLSTYDPLLLMTSGQSPEHHVIKRHTNAIELKGLGVHMNFMGTFKFHASTMKQKFDGLARRLRQSHLSPRLSRAFYQSFYLPSVKYSLPVSSMDELDLKRIQSKMTASTLNALGFNQHYPHAVVFAPKKVFGCGLLDIRIEQGLSHLQALLDYIGTDHKVGNVMTISLRHLQLEAGVSFDLMRHPLRPVSYLTDCWMLQLRSFCAKFNISLHIRDNKIPHSARGADSFLMEHALKLGLRPQELVDLNLVRTYLQVTTVSDIATACGTQLHWMTWQCQRIPDRCSRSTFARQPSVSSGQRGLWRKLMRSLVIETPKTSPMLLVLRLSLGSWTAESNQIWSTMIWDSNLYRRDPHLSTGDREVGVHFPRQLVHSDGSVGVSTFFHRKPDWYSATMPRLAVPADLSGNTVLKATCSSVSFPIATKPAKTFAAWRLHIPAAEKRLVSSIYFEACDAESALIQYIQLKCMVFIGTAGGKKRNRGSFSWIICSPGKEQLVLNAGPVDGWNKCHNYLRSEETALASVTLYLAELVQFHSLDIQCSFHLYTKNKSAINNVNLIRDLIPKRKFVDNADVLSHLRSAPNIISRFITHHVKSHWDETKRSDTETFGIDLHASCELLASTQLQRQETNDWEATQTCALPSCAVPIEVFYGKLKVTSQYISRIREEIMVDRHRKFLQKKYRWTCDTWASIAWESFHRCASRANLSQQVNRSKLAHNWLNLGKQRSQIATLVSDTIQACPYCSLPEDFQHLLTCDAPGAQKSRTEAYCKLGTTLSNRAGDLSILRAIKQWTNEPTAQIHLQATAPDLQTPLDRAVACQTTIGWPHLFRGYLSLDWGVLSFLPDSQPSSEERQATVVSHLAGVVRAIQDYTLALWQSRNDALHDNSETTGHIRQAQLNHDITTLYGLGPTFSPILQSYFTLPLGDRLKRPPRNKQRWLKMTLLATSHSTSKGSRQQVMSSYFPHIHTGTYPPEPHIPLLAATGTFPVHRQQAPIQQYFPATVCATHPQT